MFLEAYRQKNRPCPITPDHHTGMLELADGSSIPAICGTGAHNGDGPRIDKLIQRTYPYAMPPSGTIDTLLSAWIDPHGTMHYKGFCLHTASAAR